MNLGSRLRDVLVVLVFVTSLGPTAVESAPPRVVSAHPAGPFEVHVTFDMPIDSQDATHLIGRPIQYRVGKETLGALRIAAAKLTNERETLVLTTDPHPRAASYRLNFPVTGATVPIEYNLSGIEVTWDNGEDGATPAWSGYWASLKPSSLALEPWSKRKGRFNLTTLANLPAGSWTVRIETDTPLEATLGGEEPIAGESDPAHGRALFRLESNGEPMLLSLTLRTGEASAKALSARLTIASKAGVATELAPDRLLLPWIPPEPPPAGPLENVPELKGGDPVKGRAVFFGPEAKCASCHKVRSEGGEVGPDLSALVGRDRTEVYRDIFAPSARIHPDFVSYTIGLKDGRVLVGTVRAEGADKLRVTDTEAKPTIVPRAEIDQFRPSATSIMPVGLVGAIGTLGCAI